MIMKKRIFVAILMTISFFATCLSQKNTATFSDGTSIDYEVLDKNPDNMHKFSIYTLNGINLSYIKPNSFYASVKYGFWRIGGEGTIFLSTSETEKAKKHVIKSENTGYRTVTNYVIKPMVTVKTYVGIHTGYYYLDYSNRWTGLNTNYMKANEVFLGLGITRARFTKLMVNYGDKPRMLKGTLQVNFYADAIYFAGRSIIPYDSEDITTLDDISTSMGFRVYMDGKASFSRRSDIGVTWKLGYQSGPYKTEARVLDLLLGFGFYVGF